MYLLEIFLSTENTKRNKAKSLISRMKLTYLYVYVLLWTWVIDMGNKHIICQVVITLIKKNKGLERLRGLTFNVDCWRVLRIRRCLSRV